MDHSSLVYKVDISVWSSLLSSLMLLNIRMCFLLNTEPKLSRLQKVDFVSFYFLSFLFSFLFLELWD